jgi:hypothetical protein
MKAKPFLVCFEAHAAGRRPNVWAVRIGRVWHEASEVEIHVPVVTIYRGARAPEPRAFLAGTGIVTRRRSRLVITA